MVILLVAALLPAPVQAAEAKWYKGEPGYSADSKAKIGEGYFWYGYNEEYTQTYLYYAATEEGGGVKGIYSASANGKDKKKLLEINDKYGYGNLFQDSVYYYERDAGRYYKYTLSKGTTEEIDEMSFIVCLGPMGM